MQQKRRNTICQNCSWIVIYSHFFLPIILSVLYSLKCSRFHFNTPLSASHYLNNLLHFSLFITLQPLPSSSSSSPPAVPHQVSVLLQPDLVYVKFPSVLLIIVNYKLVVTPEAPQSRGKRGQQDVRRGMAAWSLKGGVRDTGKVVRRTLEWMRRKGDAFGGMGVKETDNVTPACVCRYNSMIIFSAQMCV